MKGNGKLRMQEKEPSETHSTWKDHTRQAKDRKEATPFHLPSHVSANGYYRHDLWPRLPKRSSVYKGRWMGNNRVRGRDRRDGRHSARGWRHESVERGELNGAETNLKKPWKERGKRRRRRRRSTRYAWMCEYRARITLFSLRFRIRNKFLAAVLRIVWNVIRGDRSWQKLKSNLYLTKVKFFLGWSIYERKLKNLKISFQWYKWS